ncbi:hypothetical protein [Rickettsiella endosymbiont of Miltochrista miniata]|uniref:hypothetical protein n=1 Tax=Rickettsiella endosymbiont of Miltochrista miniata TaxID=3066239 RepID=UPI00313DC675
MPPIDLFNSAFNIFFNTGRFEISDSSLSLKQLQALHSHLTKYPIPVGRTVPFYEIHLNNVEFVPFHIEELIEPKGSEDTVLSGELAEQELPASLKGRPEFNSEDKTLRILNYLERAEHFQKIDYKHAVEAIEKTLLNLFDVAKWEIIKLEGITISGKEESKPLNFQFIFNLYETLSPYVDQIKELSLKRVDLFNKDALVDLLKKTSNLEILRLEDIQKEQNFLPSFNAPNVLLNRLCEALANHCTLRQLDLGDATLNEEDYLKLFELLKNNYSLDQILLKSAPVLEDLNRLHRKLIQHLEERSEKSSLERFQEKQLTAHNLYQLAELGLQLKSPPLKLLLNFNNKIVITRLSSEKLPENLINRLPKDLQKYPDYLQQSWPIELDMSQRLDNRTLGAHLLEKAFQLKNPKNVELLLSAGADLLERLPGEPSLVERLFSSKDNVCKKVILSHVKKDLKFFVPLIWRFYTSHKEISNKLGSIKQKLDDFLMKLLDLDQLPFLLKIFRGIGLDAKKENWEKDFRLIVQAAQAGTTDYPVSDTALTEFTQVIRCLHGEAERAKRQHFRDFKFNQALCTELDQLLGFTEVYQKQFKLEEEKSKLEKKVQSLQGTIEVMKQDKRETDVKHAQDLIDLTAKYEAKGEKDRAEIRAEFEQNKSEMAERMNKIMDLLASQQQTSTSDTQTQDSSNASCRWFKP